MEKEEIFNHPSRKFLQNWKSLGIDNLFSMFCVKNPMYKIWTMATNFDKPERKPL